MSLLLKLNAVCGGMVRHVHANWRTTLFSSLMLVSSLAHADLKFSAIGNRYHLNADKDRGNIGMTNVGQESALVQASLYGEEGEAMVDLPIMLSPNMLEVKAGESKIMEIFYQGSGLPKDRESLFMLKVREIAQIENLTPQQVQVAVTHHLKVYWRPKGLGEAEQQVDKVRWSQADRVNHFIVSNDSPNYITLVDLELSDSKGCEEKLEHVLIKPFSQKLVSFTSCQLAGQQIKYGFLRDDGYGLGMKVQTIPGQTQAGVEIKATK